MSAYNTYGYGTYPYGYNYGYGSMPYQNQQPQQNYNYQQPQPQPMQQQPQQPQPNNYFFVNGWEGAKSFQMQPNQTIMLMDSDNPLCYMKTSNNLGQSTLRYFRLVEVSENDLKNGNNQQQQPKNNEYVLKSDFDILNKKVNDLLDKVQKPYKNENSKGNKVIKDE